MPDPKEPKKETVRITLPPRVTPNPAEAAAARRDTVRINLPARPPANGMEPNRPVSAAPPPTPPSSPRPPISQPAPPRPVSPPTFLPPPISSSPATSAPQPAFAPSAPFAAGMPATETELVSPGPKKETARITVLQNGVLVQDNAELTGPTYYMHRPPYVPHAEKLPLLLQDHDQPVSFRNIWIRELSE